jgi:glycerol-3-phosphate dehydrogenase (NAD(P)+)
LPQESLPAWVWDAQEEGALLLDGRRQVIAANRAAGELLAQGVPASEVPEKLGQVSEALETVSLLARACESAQVDAPVISALARLIDGTLPLDDWVAMVRTAQPEPARFEGSFWRRIASWFRRLRARRRTRRPQLSSNTR